MVNMKYLLNCRSFISLMVLFSFFDNFGMEKGETDEDYDHLLNKDNDYNYLFKVVFVGDAGVGKTQIINKFVENKFSENCASTIGVDFKVKTVKCENKKIKLQLWDTAGQKTYKNIMKAYYKGSQLIVLVYAVDDKNSFDSIPKLVDEVKEQIENPKFLLVENKCDLEKDKRQVSTEEAQQYAKDNNMRFIEVSAKNGTNINDDMFNSIIQELLDDMEAEEKKEEIQVENHNKNIDINHINDNDIPFCNKYCSCCPCIKKTKKNNEEQEEKEGEEQEEKEGEEQEEKKGEESGNFENEEQKVVEEEEEI